MIMTGWARSCAPPASRCSSEPRATPRISDRPPGALAAAALLFALGSGALAQAHYPSRPITLLGPFPPGGSADTVTPPVAQKVPANMKAPIVIDNRPGGGGNVAAQATKAAAPD